MIIRTNGQKYEFQNSIKKLLRTHYSLCLIDKTFHLCNKFITKHNVLNLHVPRHQDDISDTVKLLNKTYQCQSKLSFVLFLISLFFVCNIHVVLKTLLLLNTACPILRNGVDPDQVASEEANWSESALLVIKYVNFYQKLGSSNLIGWKLEVGVAS